jgi:hypothetical protein
MQRKEKKPLSVTSFELEKKIKEKKKRKEKKKVTNKHKNCYLIAI